jgi:hypothetical protein
VKATDTLPRGRRGDQKAMEMMRCVDKSTVSDWRATCDLVEAVEGKVVISQLSHFQPSHATDRKDRLAVRKRLQHILSVSESLLDEWLSRAEKDLKDEARKTAFALWLACHAQTEIAELVGWPQQTVARWLGTFTQNPDSGLLGTTDESEDSSFEEPLRLSKQQLADAEHATEFEVPCPARPPASPRTAAATAGRPKRGHSGIADAV